MKTIKLNVHQKINYRSWFKENNDWFFMLVNRIYASFGYSDDECFTSVNAPFFKNYLSNRLYIHKDSELGIKLN